MIRIQEIVIEFTTKNISSAKVVLHLKEKHSSMKWLLRGQGSVLKKAIMLSLLQYVYFPSHTHTHIDSLFFISKCNARSWLMKIKLWLLLKFWHLQYKVVR